MELETAIAEYHAALQAKLKLSQQETILKQRHIAAHNRLNRAKDELRALELEMTDTLNRISA